MPTTIKLKNSVTTTNAPSSLAQGEVAINVTDKKVWVGNAATTPVQLLGAGSDGSFTNISVSGVASFADGTVSLPSITNIGDTNTGIFFPAADTIAFTEGGTEAARFDSSGQLLIGATSGSYPLVVKKAASSSDSSTISVVSGTAGYAQVLLGDTVSDAVGYLAYNNSTNSLEMATNGSERMRIDSSGNVGIGTSSPTTRLSVVSATNAGISVNDGTVNTIIYNSTGGVGSIGTTTNHPVDFYANNSARMRLDTSGNVGIGTTNTAPANGTGLVVGSSGSIARIDMRNSTTGLASGDGTSFYLSGNDFTIENRETGFVAFATSLTERMRIDSSGNLLLTTAGNYFQLKSASTLFNISAQAGGNDFLRITANGTQRFQFNDIGAAYNSTGTWGTISDARLKENIVDATSKLDKVNQLRVVNYNLKSDPDVKQIGFIAQEIEQVFPSLVDNLDEDGEGGYFKSVKTTVLIPILVKAIQEQQAIITDLKSRIEALENK
jgi:hypothetical protein